MKGRIIFLLFPVLYGDFYSPFIFQVTLSGNIHAPPEAAALFGKHPLFNGHIAKKTVPPPMVERKSRAPFLFKFCRVVYDKERKRLHIQDGEFVGRPVRSHRELRSDMLISDEEAALYLEMEESLTQGKIINTNGACLAVMMSLQHAVFE